MTPWTKLYSPWNSPGQNTGVGSLSLLRGIFPTQGLSSGLPHYRWILTQLSHKGSPRILEWVAYPFFSGSSQPRNQTRVSCIAGRFFTNWTIKKRLKILEKLLNLMVMKINFKINANINISLIQSTFIQFSIHLSPIISAGDARLTLFWPLLYKLYSDL